jgi:Flp pilus assembly protein TadG
MHSRSGAVLVEAAITVLLLFTFLFAIVEAGRFFQVQQLLTDAAREGARLAVAPRSHTTTVPTDAEILDTVQHYLDAGGIGQASLGCDGAGVLVCVSRPVRLTDGALITSPCTVPCGAKIRVQAPYQVVTLSMFSNLSLTLKGQAVMRNETSP